MTPLQEFLIDTSDVVSGDARATREPLIEAILEVIDMVVESEHNRLSAIYYDEVRK